VASIATLDAAPLADWFASAKKKGALKVMDDEVSLREAVFRND
jgi:hypothetical protein